MNSIQFQKNQLFNSKENNRDRGFFTSIQQFQKDDIIYYQDKPIHFLYEIVEGQIRVGESTLEGELIPKAILTKGDWLGVSGMMNDRKHQDTAVCLSSCTVKAISVNRFKHYLTKHPEQYSWLLDIVGKYLQKIERRHRILSLKSSNDRVLQFLYDWVKNYGQRVGWETLVREVLHHNQIALLTIALQMFGGA